MKKLVIILTAIISVISCTKKDTNQSERFIFRTEGVDLNVVVQGNIASKIMILLLHGGPGGGADAYNQGYYSDKLEEKYAMIYVDQRGNGASMGTYNSSDLTIEQNSKDIYNLTLFLKKKYGQNISLFLMGHSWGGLTTAHTLISTPIQNELKGWIEVDGAHDFPMNDKESVKFFMTVANEQLALNNETEFWTEIKEKVSQMDTNNILESDLGYLNSKGFEAESKILAILPGPQGGDYDYTLLTNPNSSILIKAENSFNNPILNADSQKHELTDSLYKITIPSQFLWGKYDLVVPPALGYSAFNKVGTVNKELVIFNHSGHSPMNNEAELFVTEVIDFIELYK